MAVKFQHCSLMSCVFLPVICFLDNNKRRSYSDSDDSHTEEAPVPKKTKSEKPKKPAAPPKKKTKAILNSDSENDEPVKAAKPKKAATKKAAAPAKSKKKALEDSDDDFGIGDVSIFDAVADGH